MKDLRRFLYHRPEPVLCWEVHPQILEVDMVRSEIEKLSLTRTPPSDTGRSDIRSHVSAVGDSIHTCVPLLVRRSDSAYTQVLRPVSLLPVFKSKS